MESTTSMTTPPEQVDSLIQMVADEAGLQLAGKLDTAGPVGSGGAVVEEKVSNPANDLEARLAQLRN